MEETRNSENSLLKLLEKYVENTCSREELQEFLRKIEQESDKGGLSEILKTYWEKSKHNSNNLHVNWEEKFALMMKEAKSQENNLRVPQVKKRYHINNWLAAATVLFMISAGLLWLYVKKNSSEIAIIQGSKKSQLQDIAPGRNTATLTLADGSIIILDSVKKGTITKQENVSISKLSEGLISFNYSDRDVSKDVYNVITTPRGGQYQVELSDGTRVWLNAASSLKFPAAFIGSERNVVLGGEAYFEVTKQPGRPFNVIVNGMRVDVLGTHFNVNAYIDEKVVTTTLLEGSVKVTNQLLANSISESVVLKPGQQANLANGGVMKVVNDVNVDQIIAWKNGQFQFQNQDLASIFRQVSRWYDVNVIYQGGIPKRSFTGRISRNSNASQVIEMLRYAGINLKLENKTILVLP